MKQGVTPPQRITRRPSLSGVSNTHLHGLSLLLARMSWIMLAALALGIIGIGSLVVCGGTGCPFDPLSATSALLWILAGILLFWCKSDEWLALLIALLCVLQGAMFEAGANALELHATPWQMPVLLLDFFRLLLIFLTFALFPDGRFVPGWTRWIVIGCSLMALPLFLFPAIPAQTVLGFEFVLYAGLGCLTIAQVYRYRRVSGPIARQQTKWFLLSMSVFIFVGVGLVTISLLFPPLSVHRADSPTIDVLVLTMLLLPLSLVAAMLRYHLWDVDLLIHRTLVYGILSASVVGLYVFLVGGLGILLQVNGTPFTSLLALLVTGLVAVLFQPMRLALQRAINRLLYGERDEPYTVLSRLGRQLETTLTAEAMLPTMVETIAHTFKVPYAAITVKQGQEFSLLTSYGIPGDDLLRLPLMHHTETVGELLLAPRAPGEAFTAADDRLLADLTHQAGAAVHAVHLTADVQRSRERLVTAREEERRRLRRDLHDGLGPMLASLTIKLDVARHLLTEDIPGANALLIDLKAQTQDAIADIRRLVYALRPPTLDELGLVSALREHASHYQHAGFQVLVEAPEPLPPFSAALEVALYRIAQEAFTNVVRHAHAEACTIEISCTDVVCLAVCDDGCGIPETHQVGVGLTSMRERAAELGGTCDIQPGKAGGTCVFARFPLPKECSADYLKEVSHESGVDGLSTKEHEHGTDPDSHR
ncbi:MAG TPA: sensor histidine kinase [Ktedonobacteraceae bacterium]